MKKFLAVLIMLFSSIGVLISCSSKNPNCSLEVTSTGNTISYTLSFENLNDKQTSYKVELFKGETSIKQELVSVDVSAGSFRELEFNADYKVSVFISDKEEYDLLLISKDIKTQLGTLTGISFSDKTFTYDGTPKSIEVTNLPQGATVTYVGNGVSEVGVHTVTATIKKANYSDLTLTAKLTITSGNVVFDLEDKIVVYDGNEHTITATSSDNLEFTYEYYQGETRLESAPINAGYYLVKAIYAGDKNHAKVEKTANLTIQKATYDMRAVSFSDATYTYDGTEKELVITGTLPNGVSVSYENNKLTNAGSVIAKAKFIVADVVNYNAIEDKVATLKINKAEVELTADDILVEMGQNYEVTYTCSVSGLNLVIKYFDADSNEILKPSSNGTYKAEVSFEGNENYLACSITVNITIYNPALGNVTIEIDSIHTVFNENYEVRPVVTPEVEVTIKYFKENVECSKPVDAGTYRVEISFAGNETLNPKVVSVDLVIAKATYDLSSISFSDTTYTYDGTEKELVITGTLPEGVSVTYKNNTLTNVGSILATAMFVGVDSKNYNLIEDQTATLTISKADSDLSTLTQTIFELDYVTGITIENFKAQLDAKNLTVSDYSQTLSFGNQEIVATYTQSENHNPVTVTITLVCNKAINGFKVLDDHRQIKGRDFDSHNLVVYHTFNDGSEERIAKQPTFTVSNTSVDTTNVFSVEVTLTSGNFSGQTVTVEVTPIEQPNVMIYAVYTAGGNANATYTHDFIILYNGSAEDIQLAGWTVQYINSKKNATSIALNGEIKAYGYYTIRCGSQSVNVGASLPFTADMTNNQNMAVGDCSVYLATTKTAITDNYEALSYVDILGIGTAAPYKEDIAVAKPSNNVSYLRREKVKDTNHNFNDFEMVAFNGTNDFDYLNPGHNVYNYAKSYIENLGLDFENLPDSFVLPVSFAGSSIQWSTDVPNLNISADGTVVVTKNPTAFGTLTGTIEGYPLALQYEVKVSDRIILKTPEITLSHLTLTWNEVANATHYEIYVNGQEYAEVSSCSYELRTNPDFETIFSDANSYSITVKACATDLDLFENSEMSDEALIQRADTANLTPNTMYLFKVVVTAKSTGLQSNFFVIDPVTNIGLLVFNFPSDVEVKDVIYISGKYEVFNNLSEITNVSGVTKLDILDDTKFAKYIKLDEPTLDHVSYVVHGENAEVLSKPEVSSNYANVLVKLNNITYNLYANKNYVGDIEAFKTMLPGNKINFNGAVGRYNNTLQIYLTSYTVTDVSVSAEYMLDSTLDEIVLKTSYIVDEVVNLPVQGTQYTAVQITYISTTGGNLVSSDTATTLTFDSSATSVTITITVTVGEVFKTKEVVLTIKPAGSMQEEIQAYTFTFNAKEIYGLGSDNAKNLGGVTWIADGTSLNNAAAPGNKDANKGQQFGTASNPFQTLTFNLNNPSLFQNVTKIEIEASGASSVKATLGCKVGQTSCNVNDTTDSNVSITATSTVYTFRCDPTTGDIIIEFNQTSSKGLYIKSVTVYTTN